VIWGPSLLLLTHVTSVYPASLSLSIAIFPGGPGLAGSRMSPFWILLELRMLEVVVTTGAIRRAELQSNRHHQQNNTHFYGLDALHVALPTMSEHWRKKYHYPWTLPRCYKIDHIDLFTNLLIFSWCDISEPSKSSNMILTSVENVTCH